MGYWAGRACSHADGLCVCVCVWALSKVCVEPLRGEKGENVWSERYHVSDASVWVRCVSARLVIGANHTTLTKHNATTEPVTHLWPYRESTR